MGTDHIQKAIKQDLQRVERKLSKTEALQSAAWIGSGVGAGLILSSQAEHIPILIGMAAGGAILDVATKRILSQKK